MVSGEIFELSDFVLMYYWIMLMSVQIGVFKDYVEFFQSLIFEVGFMYFFVSYVIFSVVVLYVVYLFKVGCEQYIICVIQYYNVSLEGFRNVCFDISEGNSEVFFIWFMLNFFYVLGFIMQSLFQVLDRKDRILGVEWIFMLQGVIVVFYFIFEYLQYGWVKDMLILCGWKDFDLDKFFDKWFDIFLLWVWELWKDLFNVVIYEIVFFVLRKCLLFVS